MLRQRCLSIFNVVKVSYVVAYLRKARSLGQTSNEFVLHFRLITPDALLLLIDKIHGHSNVAEIGRVEGICSYNRFNAQPIRQFVLHSQILRVLLHVLLVHHHCVILPELYRQQLVFYFRIWVDTFLV